MPELDIDKLREQYAPLSDTKSWLICDLCDLVEEREKRIEELEAEIEIPSHDVTWRSVISTLPAVARHRRCDDYDEIVRLLKEIGDET